MEPVTWDDICKLERELAHLRLQYEQKKQHFHQALAAYRTKGE